MPEQLAPCPEYEMQRALHNERRRCGNNRLKDSTLETALSALQDLTPDQIEEKIRFYAENGLVGLVLDLFSTQLPLPTLVKENLLSRVFEARADQSEAKAIGYSSATADGNHSAVESYRQNATEDRAIAARIRNRE